MEVINCGKRIIPCGLDIELSNEAKLIIEIMDDDGVEISCDSITESRYWLDHWKQCPLCGATRGMDGIMVHQGEH